METKEQIIRTEYSEVMQKSYIDYAMSVIIARALPDVRDGLKPVQRRTLYDMHELGIRYDKPYRKCARIVGDTMGKYHPHGDSSIYDALVECWLPYQRQYLLLRLPKGLAPLPEVLPVLFLSRQSLAQNLLHLYLNLPDTLPG